MMIVVDAEMSEVPGILSRLNVEMEFHRWPCYYLTRMLAKFCPQYLEGGRATNPSLSLLGSRGYNRSGCEDG